MCARQGEEFLNGLTKSFMTITHYDFMTKWHYMGLLRSHGK